jgi:hypothetical protein
MLRYLCTGLLLNTMVSATPVVAQEPQTEAGARTAAIALLRARPGTPDSTRIVTDSTALYAELVHCKEVAGGPPECSMIDGKQVLMVIAHLNSATTAAIEVRYYHVMRGSCPLGRPLPTPIIAHTRTESFTLGYADGHWKPTGGGRGIEC